MSTEHNFTTGSEQWNWLYNDLKNVNRKVTPWVIFGGHRAMYLNSYYCCSYSSATYPYSKCNTGCSPTSDVGVMRDMVRYIEPLLYEFKVNFAFYGHNHVVQRQSAVLNYTVIQRSEPKEVNGNTVNYYNDPQATVHFVIGTGGAAFTKNSFSTSSPFFPAWNELTYYRWGYAIVEAQDEYTLSYQWIDNDSGEVVDRAIIYQSNPNQPFNGSATDDDLSPSSSDNNNNSLSQTSIIIIAAVGGVALFVAISFGVKYLLKNPSSSSSTAKLQLDEEEAAYSPLAGDSVSQHGAVKKSGI